MNIGTANGKLFLLYQHLEEPNVDKMRKQLTKQGIICIPCDDPANFRFVTPEVIRTSPENLDLIGRAALKYLTDYTSCQKFVRELSEALPPQIKPPA